ncbi:MAG: hypothetical protein WAM73_03950 [Desulfobacterales bacterium]
MVPSNVKLLAYHPDRHPARRIDSFGQPPPLAVVRRAAAPARLPHPRRLIGCVGRSYESAGHGNEDHRDASGRLIDIYA